MIKAGSWKKRAEKCPDCKLYESICICSDIIRFDLKTRITLLTHVKEVNKATNSGKIVKLMLSNCTAPVLGLLERPLEKEDLIFEGYENLVLFPHASSVLTEETAKSAGRPVNLIVPDGNYSQAVKMTKSHLLEGLKRVRLPSGQKSSYGLRKMSDPEKISTAEAVVRALEITGDSEAAAAIEKVFLKMTEGFRRIGNQRTN